MGWGFNAKGGESRDGGPPSAVWRDMVDAEGKQRGRDWIAFRGSPLPVVQAVEVPWTAGQAWTGLLCAGERGRVAAHVVWAAPCALLVSLGGCEVGGGVFGG